MNRWLIPFILVLTLGSAWLWWSRPVLTADTGAGNPGPGVGRVAPDFSLPLVDGGTFSLAAQRGKPVVLNFWATWCGPCQRELPAIQRAAEHYGEDVVFVGVDQGETAEAVQRYVDKLGLTFEIPMDGDGEIGFQYNVKGLPTTFFIDREGIIRSYWMGEMNSMTLAENIGAILP